MKTKSLKEITKRISTLFLSILMLLTIMPLTSFAANYSTNYSAYSAPTRTLSYQRSMQYGNDVRWFQCAINYLIVYGDTNGSKLSTYKLDVDGYYGNASKTACIAFQRKYGLSQDGMFGPASRTKMQNMLKRANYSTNYSAYTAPTRTLIYQNTNMYGNDVRWFQCAINYLIANGDTNGSKLSTSKLNVDGYYGSASRTACIAFQKKYGLTQSGKFDSTSRSKMQNMLKRANYSTNYSAYSAPTRTLVYKSPNMSGNDVRWFQCAINYLIVNGDTNGSKLSTSKVNVTGAYNAASRTACIAFQRKYGLTQSGKVDSITRSKMQNMLKRANYSTNYSAYSAPTRTLVYQSPNMSGNDVRWFQCAINYLIVNGDTNGSKLSTSKVNVTGTYNAASRTACIAFQRKYGLTQSGKVDSITRSKMQNMLKRSNYLTNYSSYAEPTRTLIYKSPNMSGNDVRWFQCAINYLIVNGDKNKSKLSTSKIVVNGSYNAASKNACIAFQKKYGLSQDGMFGPASLSKMKEVLNITTPVAKYLKDLIGTAAKEWGCGTGTQCVELPKYYMEKYFGIANKNIATGNGNQMYYMIPKAFPTKFTQVNYTKGMKLLPGDILSMGSTSSPQYGHAVVVYEVSGNTIKVIEQWKGCGTVKSNTITITNGVPDKYVKIYGVARPKNLK